MAINPLPHRKRVRHYHDPAHCHELTFSTYHRRPILTNDPWQCMLSEAIDRATANHNYRSAAFVFMPEHVHLLVHPLANASRIDELLSAIKRPFSFRIKRLLQHSGDPLVDQLTVRQRPGVNTFRFWQEGPGYDRNLDRVETVLAAIDYIHRNPVRRELVATSTDWQWSSARWYAGFTLDPAIRIPTLTKLPAEFLATTLT